MERIIYRHIIRHLFPVLLLLSTSAQAGALDVPNSFTAGSAAKASEVNANFNAVETAVNDNDARITGVESDVATLEGNVSDNSVDIAELQNQIATLISTVNSLNGTVTTLQGQVDDLEDELATVQAANQFAIDLDAVADVVDSKVVFSGVNVQIVNGTGLTIDTENPPNGLGNLIVGYDENNIGADRSGSHNIVVGPEHTYSSYGGLVAGLQNIISGVSASVSGGSFNTASGAESSVSGGAINTASGTASSVSGGSENIASGTESSVSGGTMLEASGDREWQAGTP